MTCSLHSKLDAAIAAAKAVFDEAHDKDTLSDSDLNLVFVYYQFYNYHLFLASLQQFSQFPSQYQ